MQEGPFEISGRLWRQRHKHFTYTNIRIEGTALQRLHGAVVERIITVGREHIANDAPSVSDKGHERSIVE